MVRYVLIELCYCSLASLFRRSNTICSVWSRSQSASQHCITPISMYLYERNPPAFFHTWHPHSLLICFSRSLSVLSLPLLAAIQKCIVHRTLVSIHPCLRPDGRRVDPVSKPTFVLEPGSGSGDQMWKQCSHLAITEAAITDKVDSAKQSKSAYCLSDICFPPVQTTARTRCCIRVSVWTSYYYNGRVVFTFLYSNISSVYFLDDWWP